MPNLQQSVISLGKFVDRVIFIFVPPVSGPYFGWIDCTLNIVTHSSISVLDELSWKWQLFVVPESFDAIGKDSTTENRTILAHLI